MLEGCPGSTIDSLWLACRRRDVLEKDCIVAVAVGKDTVQSMHWVAGVAVEQSSNSNTMEQVVAVVVAAVIVGSVLVAAVVVAVRVQEVDLSLLRYSWSLGEVGKQEWRHSYLVRMLVFA